MDASAPLVQVIQRFEHSIVVPFLEPSVLHQLDVPPTSQTSRTSLRPVIHDGYLPVQALELWRLVISDHDRRGHWVEVGTDRAVRAVWVLLPIEELLVSHLQAVRIDPELLVGVESIQESPVDHHVLPYLVSLDWQIVQLNVELDEVIDTVDVDPGGGSVRLVLLLALPDYDELATVGVLADLGALQVDLAVGEGST